MKVRHIKTRRPALSTARRQRREWGRRVRKMLRRAKPMLMLRRFGSAQPMPKTSWSTISFRRCLPDVAGTLEP